MTFSAPMTLGSVFQETLIVMVLGPKNMGEPSSPMATSQVLSEDVVFTMLWGMSICIHMRVQPPAQTSASARTICSIMRAALCCFGSVPVINAPAIVPRLFCL